MSLIKRQQEPEPGADPTVQPDGKQRTFTVRQIHKPIYTEYRMAIFLNKVKLNYSTLKRMQEIVFQGRL